MEIKSSIFGTFRIYQTITPIEPLLQKVIHRFYGPRWLAPFMKIFICGESIMVIKNQIKKKKIILYLILVST